jgi:hypothetical protein
MGNTKRGEGNTMARIDQIGKHATNISTDDGITTVVYHRTAVVNFTADNVTLNTGGWNTVTTKLRMNQASNQFKLGYSVYQKHYAWYVVQPDGTTVNFNGRITFPRKEAQ